jgi:hypothetical protein
LIKSPVLLSRIGDFCIYKPKIDGTSRQIKSEEEWEILKTLGEGKGYSQGIRNLLK